MPNDPQPGADKQLSARLTTLADPAHQAAISSVGNRLLSDASFRQSFSANPAAALRSAGVNVQGDITLSDRDKAVINLLSDQHVAQLYHANQLADLQAYLAQEYPSLVNPGGPSEGTAESDFHVIAESEAIVVGVAAVAAGVVAVAGAVAALPQQIGPSTEVQRVESTLHGRLNALEDRVSNLEQTQQQQ